MDLHVRCPVSQRVYDFLAIILGMMNDDLFHPNGMEDF